MARRRYRTALGRRIRRARNAPRAGRIMTYSGNRSGKLSLGNYRSHGDALFYKSPQTIPAYYNTKLRWTLLYSLAAGSSSPYTSQNLVMNNLNDPGGALAATRPRYTTDLMTMYGRYIVHGFAVRMVGTSQPDTTSTGDLVIGCYPAQSAAQSNNISNLPSAIAAQGCKWQVASRYANQICKVKNFVKIKRLLGYKDLADDSNNVGQTSAAPTNAPVMTLFAGTQDATGNAGFNLVVSVTYYVTFFRKDNENQPAAV